MNIFRLRRSPPVVFLIVFSMAVVLPIAVVLPTAPISIISETNHDKTKKAFLKYLTCVPGNEWYKCVRTVVRDHRRTFHNPEPASKRSQQFLDTPYQDRYNLKHR